MGRVLLKVERGLDFTLAAGNNPESPGDTAGLSVEREKEPSGC